MTDIVKLLKAVDAVVKPVGNVLAVFFDDHRIGWISRTVGDSARAIKAVDELKVFTDPFHEKTEKVGIVEWTQKELYELIHGEVNW